MVAITVFFAAMVCYMSYRLVMLQLNGRPGRRVAPPMHPLAPFPFERFGR
jgi:hypothetical protein